MPRITLPDGSVKEFPQPVTALEVAKSIGSRLAQAALGCKINGELSDLSTLISADSTLAIVTSHDRQKNQDKDALFLIRHSAAHVMAEAIQRIIPEAQLVYGPPLEDKFYYDIKFPDSRPLKEGDFAAIEAEIKKILAEDRPFTRYEQTGTVGIGRLESGGNKYKLDNAVKALEAQGVSVSINRITGDALFTHQRNGPADFSGSLSFYATGTPGQNWEDLCRGPHVPST
ncbi:MAG: TGS domain-containing protein, partial [Phycisphaerales bacterium]|nr:TGS domain-containing protein [Phycisphaerales bacterium]